MTRSSVTKKRMAMAMAITTARAGTHGHTALSRPNAGSISHFTGHSALMPTAGVERLPHSCLWHGSTAVPLEHALVMQGGIADENRTAQGRPSKASEYAGVWFWCSEINLRLGPLGFHRVGQLSKANT